jgi:hypothetical protein
MSAMTTTDRSPAAAPSRRLAGSGWWVALLVVLALAPIAVSAAFGAFGLVRNDDWAWAEILWHWTESGSLRLNGWPSMFLIGQLALAWPVGRLFPDSLVALELFTVGVGVVGVLATYWTLRQFLSASRAALPLALMLLSPLYAPLAMSFMTDVPAFTAQAGCLALGVRALTARNAVRLAGWTAAAMAIGIVGFTIREYAIVAPAAVGLVLLTRAIARRARDEIFAVAVPGLAAVVLALGLLSWRLGMRGSLTFKPSLSSAVDGFGADFGRSVLYTVVTLTFLVLPVFVFVPVRPLVDKIASRRGSTVAALGFFAAALAGVAGGWRWSPPILSPYLDERGTFGTDVLPGARATLLPDLVFKALLVVVLAASVLLVVVLVASAANALGRSKHRRVAFAELDARAILVLFVLGSIAAIVTVGTFDLPIFDRYLLVVSPFVAGLVLDTAPAMAVATHARRLVQWASVATFALLGLAWTTDSAAFDAARWHAGNEAVAMGVPADRIDAGFEWRNNFRSPGTIVLTPSQPDPDACVVMTVQTPGQTEATDTIVSVTWSSLFGERGKIVGHQVDGPDCPPLP